MAERSRRARRQISDMMEESPEVSDADSDDFDPRKQDAARRAGKQEAPISPSRPKRSTVTPTNPYSISNDSSNHPQSIRLTMKVAPSKLREVMRANEVDSLRDTLGGGQVLDGPRSRRSATKPRASGRGASRPKYAEPQESDLDADEDELAGEAHDHEDDEEGEEDTAMDDFDEIGAEAEGGTDEEDVEMDDSPAPMPLKRNQDPPKPPKITLKTPSKKSNGTSDKPIPRPSVIVTPADVGPLQSVEDEEMEDDPDDEELEDVSELPDDENEEDEDDEEDEEDAEGDEDQDETNLNNEEDVEGEDEDLDGEEDDEDLDSDEEAASGAATPDPSRMTSRQRGKPVEPLMSLDMAPQQRKFFTDEEKAMKKDEHARKRKELTKRKTQEEKTAALNRLLKPQVSKSRGAAPKAETLAAQMQAAAEEEEIEIKADPLYTRWVSTKDGIKLGVPEEWLGKNVGRYFGGPPANGRLVQEVE